MNIKSYLQSTSGRFFLMSFGLYVAGTGAIAVNGPESSWALYCLMFTLVSCGGIYCLGISTNGSGLSAAGLVLFGPILAPGFIVITYLSPRYGAGPGYALITIGALIMLSGLLKSSSGSTETNAEVEAS